MHMQPQEPPLPPPPRFALDTDLDPSSEIDIPDLEDDQGEGHRQLAQDTVEEEIEFMGTYPSLEAYARSVLEEFIAPAGMWVLDHLDWEAVLNRMEAGRYRYVIEGGAVYRAGMPQQRPTKDNDPSPGPWMPTRGQ